MKSLDIERKYIEERVRILRELERKYGKEVIRLASEAKKKLISKRIKKQYKDKIPVDLDTFFRIIFGDFEGIDKIINFTLLKKTDKELEVRINKCWYAEIYRKLKAEDIGYSLVCQMDPSMNKVLNPKIKLSRPKMLMKGDECCIFRYKLT
jgi:hypothetical protein